MADENITISFADAPSGNDGGQAGASSALGEGLTDSKEDKNKLYERLLNDMTDAMSGIFDLLSGNGKNEGPLSELRETAAAILGGEDAVTEDSGITKDKNTSFTKASKLVGLKPNDINIVDQQYILGSLLINTTLERIENTLTALLKNNSSGKKAPSAKESSNEGPSNDKNTKGLKGFKENVKDFQEINAIAQTLIPLCMANLKAVKWALVHQFFKNFKKTLNDIIEISNELEKNKESIEEFIERSGSLIGGVLIMALGLSAVSLFTPLLLISVLGAHALKLATKPILEVVDSIGKNKNIDKFRLNAGKLFQGMLSMLAAVTLLTLMLPMLPLAILSSLFLTVTVLAMRLVLAVMPDTGAIAKGTLSALLLAVFFSCLALAVFMVHTVGTDIKKTALNMAVIGIVALGGALIAMVLGIPFVLGLVALGTVTAMSLVVFFAAILLAVKMVAKTGRYTDDAIAAMGHISKKSVQGDDGTEKKDATGILGFFSILSSWTFIKALLISVLTNSLLAISAIGLYIGAKLVYSAFDVLAKMSEEYFPVGVAIKDTTPGAAIIAISHFAKFISGKEDANGNPINGNPIIGWGTLLEIAPLLVYGILLKLAAKFLKDGFDAMNLLDEKQMQEVSNKAVILGGTLRDIRDNLKPNPDGKGGGFINWIMKQLIPGGGNIGDAIEWMTACLPLFSLMLYGWLLKNAAEPIQAGIDAIGNVDPSKVTPEKMNAIGTAISGMIGPIKGFTDGFMDHSDRYGNIVDAICGLVSTFPALIDVIIKLSDKNMSQLNRGLANFAYLLDQLIGTPDSRSFLEKMGEGLSFGMYDSGKGAKQGSLLSALSSIKDNGVKVNTSVFDQIVELMQTITPISDQVIKFAELKPEQLQAGIDGIKAIINSSMEIMNAMGGTGGNGEKALNQVLTIMENNSAAKANSNNPLFAIVDLFSKLGDFEVFTTNVHKFGGALQELTSSMNLMNGVDLTGFHTFVSSITSSGISAGVRQIEKLVSYKADIDALTESFDKLGNALNNIANIDTSKLTKVVEETNASALAVIQAQHEAEANMQGMVTASAVDEYTRYIADILTAWESNGIKIRQSNGPNITVIPPRVNNATTAGRWE